MSENVEKLANVRHRLGKSQLEFALMIGIERSYLSQLENGKKPIQQWILDRVEKINIEAKLQNKQTAVENSGPYYGQSGGRCPIISWASAGVAHAYEDQGTDVPHILTMCKDQNCYALSIVGDSMEPVYHEGDIAVVTPNREAINGQVVIAKTVEDEVFIKLLRFGRDPTAVSLVSYNPAYPPYQFQRSELRFLHPVYSVTRYLVERP